MTALGKVLVFVVLILALIWNALVVNAYVTRTNWKNELDRAQKKLVEASESANAERTKADALTTANSAVVDQKEKEIVRLRSQVVVLTKDAADAKKALDIAQGAEQALQMRDKEQTANVQKVQSQNDILQRNLDTTERSLNDAIISNQKAQSDALQASINEKAALARAETADANLLKARDPNNGKGGVGSFIPPTDENFKATVTGVASDIITINQGSNSKLQKGAILQLSRTDPTPLYLGNLTITSVDVFYAYGKFVPAAGAKGGTAPQPKIGDKVSVIK